MKKTIKVNNEEKEINYIPRRYIRAILIAVTEVIMVLAIITLLIIFVPFFGIPVILTQIIVMINVAVSDNNPDYKIPWILIISLLPVVGFMTYFLFAKRKLSKKFIKRLEEIEEEYFNYDDNNNFNNLKELSPTYFNEAKLLCNISSSKLLTNTDIKYLKIGEEYFECLIEDLKNAKEFILMEYFIIEDGMFWNTILEILKEKADEGLDIKVIFDDVGCMMTLPGNYLKELKSYGIDATIFSKLKPNADSEFNNRNHRKITVIDGRIGYTGGINLADEYINKIKKYGHWKDGGIRLEGEGVLGLTKLFLMDFGINIKKINYDFSSYYKYDFEIKNDTYLIPFGDGPKPIYERRVAESLIEAMIADAKEEIIITTPYLIIDNELLSALEIAALKGIDVKIITPHIPDKKLIFMLTRSYYKRLIKARVKIYEYEKGFIHLKSYLFDSRVALIGTINLDYRSLVHHFENGVWFYNSPSIKDIKTDLEDTLNKSIKIELKMLNEGIFKKILNVILRIFAPLM